MADEQPTTAPDTTAEGKGEEGEQGAEGEAKKDETAPQDEGGEAAATTQDNEDEPKPKPQRLPRTKVYSINPGEGVDLAMGESGITAEEPMTVGQMFQETMGKIPDHPALRYKEGETVQVITYREYYAQVIRAAKAFLKVRR